jgi:hypothetical protein
MSFREDFNSIIEFGPFNERMRQAGEWGKKALDKATVMGEQAIVKGKKAAYNMDAFGIKSADLGKRYEAGAKRAQAKADFKANVRETRGDDISVPEADALWNRQRVDEMRANRRQGKANEANKLSKARQWQWGAGVGGLGLIGVTQGMRKQEYCADLRDIIEFALHRKITKRTHQAKDINDFIEKHRKPSDEEKPKTSVKQFKSELKGIVEFARGDQLARYWSIPKGDFLKGTRGAQYAADATRYSRKYHGAYSKSNYGEARTRGVLQAKMTQQENGNTLASAPAFKKRDLAKDLKKALAMRKRIDANKARMEAAGIQFSNGLLDRVTAHDPRLGRNVLVDAEVIKALLKDRKARSVRLQDLKERDSTGYSKQRQRRANTSKPIIIDAHGNVIDGRHRTLKLKAQGKRTAKAITATSRDIEKARVIHRL